MEATVPIEALITWALIIIIVIVVLLLLDAKSKYDCRYGWSEKGDNDFDIVKFVKILFEKDRR